MSLYNGLVEIFPLVPRKDVVLMVSEEEILSHLNIQGSCPYRSGKWKPPFRLKETGSPEFGNRVKRMQVSELRSQIPEESF